MLLCFQILSRTRKFHRFQQFETYDLNKGCQSSSGCIADSELVSSAMATFNDLLICWNWNTQQITTLETSKCGTGGVRYTWDSKLIPNLFVGSSTDRHVADDECLHNINVPHPSSSRLPIAAPLEKDKSGELRLPRSVQAIYLKPLKRIATYGVPSCDLQIRSYNVRNVEFMADFALRAAYYLGLPAAGPIPLPRIIERWTVPRSNFIFKKSQENFERITLRRLIQVQDAQLNTVETWLAFVRKHAYYGVGMKANVWHYERLGKNHHCVDLIKAYIFSKMEANL